MSADPYSPAVRSLFAAPVHAGPLAAAVTVHNEEQGLRIELSAQQDAGRITALRFRAWGCPHVIAAAEALCAQYEGRPAAELETAETGAIMRTLAVPVEKTGRILVIEDTARALGQALRDSSQSTQTC